MKKILLKNSMPLLIVEDPGSKVVTLDVWVNTGSADEPASINGVSHFLEHMLFKGTPDRKPGEVDRQIEAVGGLWNAATSIEYTHYHLTLGAPFVKLGIDVLSDVIAHAALDPVEMEKERQVILEEYYRQQDNPGSFLMTKASALSFDRSPCRRPVLGTPSTIKALSRQRLHEYYKRRYTPDNMALVLVGDVSLDEILPRIQETFGAIDASKPRKTFVRNLPTKRRFGVRREFVRPVKEAYMIMVLPAPDLSSPREVFAEDLISFILGEGRSSRLYRQVQEKKQLASSISAGYGTHRRDGNFTIYATFDYADRERLIEAIFEELNRMRDKKVSGAELERSQKMLSNQYAFSHETTAGRAAELGFYYTLTGDTDFERNYINNIQAVTSQQILDTSRKYFAPANANIFIVKPDPGAREE